MSTISSKRILSLALLLSIATVRGFCPTATSLRKPLLNHFARTKLIPSKQAKIRVNNYFASPSSSSSSTSLLVSPSLLPLDDETTQKLILLSFEKAIDAGVPALIFILTSWWFFSMIRRNNEKNEAGGSSLRNSRMSKMAGRGNNRGGRGRQAQRGRGGPANGNQRPLGPVEQLYDDIYDDLAGDSNDNIPPLAKLFSGKSGNSNKSGGIDRPTSKLNIGIPKQTYLKVTKMNSKYDSYRYSMVEATRGKATAASELRKKGFESALRRAVLGGSNSDLTVAEGTALLQLERDFLTEGNELLQAVADLTREITNAAVLDEMEAMGVEAGVLDAMIAANDTVIDAEIVNDEKNKTEEKSDDSFISSPMSLFNKQHNSSDKPKKIETQADIMRAIKQVEQLNTDILLLELEFIQSVVEILGPNRADAIRTTLVGNIVSGEAGTLLKNLKERPLERILSSLVGGHSNDSSTASKNLYVTRFPGDVSASQVAQLREEVTGILRAAQPGDEALLILQSGGGTVTGYGLAAAQLLRFKAKDIKLTICVEQVAASGGYMMCCTADRIVASPFAVLGSIGVISEIPNAYERLKQEGIEFQTITAGKFKRTITPTKKVTKEDVLKSTEDINSILRLFKEFVHSQRPQLDIENVATGETWFGEDALAKGLCDELGTADDVLLEFVDKGYDVYEVEYKPTPEGVGGLLAGLPGSSSGVGGNTRKSNSSNVGGWRGVLRSVIRGVVSDVKEEVMAELSSTVGGMNAVEKRYMAKDPSDSSNRIQVRD
mmetsp:Transcript_9652/g.19014  ORF Transcript_9652/g.19014 Transcript_9652/m.19014 type:complete len:774 (-) Transcript_9652:165-2486(-)